MMSQHVCDGLGAAVTAFVLWMVVEAAGVEILIHRLQRPNEHDKREGFPAMATLGCAVVRCGAIVS